MRSTQYVRDSQRWIDVLAPTGRLATTMLFVLEQFILTNVTREARVAGRARCADRAGRRAEVEAKAEAA